MKQIYVQSYYKRGYSRFMQYVYNILEHPQREAIEARLKIIEFCDKFGFEATKSAFGKSRATIYLWKHGLKQAGGRLSALAPGSRAPHNKRKRIVDPFIRSFIIRYRTEHPKADKVTITPILVAACKSAGIKPVSESTVGRIIHDLKEHGSLPKSTRLLMNAQTGGLKEWERQPVKKLRRKGFNPHQPGDLVQVDTVHLFVAGLKRYLFTAIDVRTRFAFAYTYSSNSSARGRDFLDKLITVTPFTVARVQTDNGSEFQKHFAQACQDKGLVHFFNYPKHPQSNGYLERFNRTIQEQFAYWHSDELDDPAVFNRSLMEYLLWYNAERPHRGIGKVPPLRYYLDNFVKNHEQSNMYWTLTVGCQFPG
ncbi:Winged helix-turn helix/Integrase core domain [Dehalogenimonas alkenigignens]|uniref:Winged helix-turn helix/Integrase core domain n=1 Tax=Dehalogenimonas alkenigignens TaxID=1217799 RepID=A0A0W0GH67_9CHLR|nr:IS481 family transposase [Dehalogenimonas alkenigignens]KTB47907.1 Winged helix-turn helix/Integrase core domain [Dehalogenimonas alkenigignens]